MAKPPIAGAVYRRYELKFCHLDVTLDTSYTSSLIKANVDSMYNVCMHVYMYMLYNWFVIRHSQKLCTGKLFHYMMAYIKPVAFWLDFTDVIFATF